MATSFTCQCHTHELHAEHDPETGIDLSFWQYGGHAWHPWSYRLRHIRRILRHGTPYSDYVSLDKADAKRLGEWLLESTRNDR